MAKLMNFEQVNPAGAAIDIGAQKIFVSVDGLSVKVYTTFTSDYHDLCAYLKEHNIERVCMEATGVYWIALHEILEAAGLEVCLVNPKEVKGVKGRKSDPKDCRWIQKVFSAGLVRQSYVPAGALKELRMMLREREDLIAMGASYVNKMGKALELMNLKLNTTLAQLQGASGLRIIEAIITGERDPEVLLALCDPRIVRAKRADMLKALEGNYNQSWIFLLSSSLKMWKEHQAQLLIVDGQIELLLAQLSFGKVEVKSELKAKAIRHHKPVVADLHQQLLNIYGVDGNSIPGFNDYTLLRLLGEAGSDMSRFATAGHFASWCQLVPVNNQSGQMRKAVRIKAGSGAGQIFRGIATGLLNSKNNAFGSFIRRIRGRKGSAVAIKAGARKLAEAFYNLLTKGAAYVEQGVEKYQKQLQQREEAHLYKLAQKLGMKVMPLNS